MSRIPFALIACLTLGLATAACGSSSNSSPAKPSAKPPATSNPGSSSSGSGPASVKSKLSVAADPRGQLKFTKSSLTAKAGKVTISFTTQAPEAHNLMVQQGTSGPVLGGTPTFTGGTKTITLQLKPGTYTYFCGVPGHREAGMQGTLTVS